MATARQRARILSDVAYCARSYEFNTPANGTVTCFALPVKSFVTDVWLYVSTACAGTAPALTVGWLGNSETAVPAGFLSADIADCMTIGYKKAVSDNISTWPGKWFVTAPGAVTLTISGTLTAGKFFVMAQYNILT